ncbi:ABC transporter ATP-binding protein [Actinomadura flavalba]|uniref:ABC transporter ATP-binding protein n=1 Tax=Actinomadura flavalba TaxID=1120938 RepID=UPI001969F7CC|nr:ABC transporter ATP-binding protein [Actinomadura flavalba]
MVLVGATLVNSVCALLLPAVLAGAADAVLREGGSAWAAGIWLGVVLIGSLAGASLVKVGEVACTSAATLRIRDLLIGHVLALGLPGERAFSAGDLTSRVVSGAPQVAAAMPVLVGGASNLAVSIGGFVALALIDWRLAATVVLAVPLGLVLMRVFVRRASDLATRYQEIQGEISARMLDALAGVRTIRASGTWRREADRILAPLPELSASGRDLWRAYGRIQGHGTLLLPLTGLAALAVAGQGVLAGRLTPGQMLAVAGYAPMALGVLGQTSLLLRLARLRAGARRIGAILDHPVTAPGVRPLPPGPGELRLRGVTVEGDGGPLLTAVDLTVPAGSSAALVGRSGAGKTTLAAVAGGLLAPDRGHVHLDGVPIDAISPGELRRAVAYAFERPHLLGADITGAVSYGSDASRSAVERAAVIAGADGFVRLLPHGYATPLDEAPLSGGERQRLGLARAFVRDARLLVLDDATSSLDTVTEAQVSQALTAGATGTRLMVAHRASTAARADTVVWLDTGRVRAHGPHDELWADPAYRALFSPAAAP